MTQTPPKRLHIVEGSIWKDAVIALLEPASPYRPWRYSFEEVSPGDLVVVVLGTDPISILTEFAHVGDDGRLGTAVRGVRWYRADVVDLTTFAAMLGLGHSMTTEWTLDGDAAVQTRRALTGLRCGGREVRFGHTSMAEARVLLHSGGNCQGCDREIDLSRPDARDEVFVHTVDAYRRPAPRASSLTAEADWPVVLCRGCHLRMQDGGYRSCLDFRLDKNPSCPQCGGRRSLSTFYGMPAGDIPPWRHAGGCCVSEERWYCDLCGYQW